MENINIKKIGHLARLALSDSEAEDYGKSLNDILSYVDALQKVDTKGVAEYKIEHLRHATFRADERVQTADSDLPVQPADYRQSFLANAPDVKNKCVVVRKVIDND